jgi:predicted nucleic acid-binding protein
MRFAVDTNWLVATYFIDDDVRRTEIVERFVARHQPQCIVSPVVLLESENVFSTLAANPRPNEWHRLQSDLGRRLLRSELTWDAMEEKARELFRRFSHRASISTFDVMIIAGALKAEATHFLSFDTRSNTRAFAAVLKLKVVPELSEEDKRRMARFR